MLARSNGGVKGAAMGWTRRDLLRAAGLTATGLLTGCATVEQPAVAPPSPLPTVDGAGRSPDFPGERITLLVYSGLTEELYKQHFVPQFAAATGAQVVVDSAWTEGIARLQAAPQDAPPFDLVLTDPTQGLPAVEAGLFQQFDTAAIGNAQQFHPRLLDTAVWRNGYGLPFHSSAMTLATNVELHPQPYQTWAELVEAPPGEGVMLYNLPYMSLYTFAAMKAEQDGAVGQAAQLLRDDLDAVLAYAVDHRSLVTYFWPSTTDAVNALVHGNVAAGNIHGNGLLAPLREGEPVAGVIPPGDVAYVQLFFAVPQGVRNLELSLAAMNHVASEEFQRSLASSGEYAAAIPSVAQAQGAADKAWAQAFPSTDAEFDALRYYPYDVYAANAERIAEVWDRDVLRGA